MKFVLRALAMLSIAALSLGATTPGAPMQWLNTISVNQDGGHVLGNPDAKVKLIAFESYTCHFCHDFETAASAPLRLQYVQPGMVSLEVRHIIRDPVDLTAVMLTECIAKDKFFDAHRQLYLHFDKTLDLLAHHTDAQVAAWTGTATNRAAGRRAIAQDFGFYGIFEQLGMSRPMATQCLNDDAQAEKLAKRSQADGDKFGITGTPSFAIDGALLSGTHTWDLLQPQLDARL